MNRQRGHRGSFQSDPGSGLRSTRKAQHYDGQYSRVENGKVEPSVSTLEKLAAIFEVSISEFFKTDVMEDDVNLPLLEKVKLIDQLENEEKNALLKMIDITISK